jgi:hypothetical protein
MDTSVWVQIALAVFGMAGAACAAYARYVNGKVDRTQSDLASFRVEVAKEYLSRATSEANTRQITDAINHLGDRIDRLFHHQRPAE